MKGNKILIYKPAAGMEFIADNRGIYLESIDMTGLSGIHTVQSLAFSNGQHTVRSQLGAKTIPCSFAFWDKNDDFYLRENIAGIFSPLQSGTLRVITRTAEYEIECRPQNIPVFNRDSGVPEIWRFDVDFVSDDPLWKKGPELRLTLANGDNETINTGTIVSNPTPFDLPIVIHRPADMGATAFKIGTVSNGTYTMRTSFTIPAADNKELYIYTDSLRIVDAQGVDCSSGMDPATLYSSFYLAPGLNRIAVSPSGGDDDKHLDIRYRHLSAGEV